MAAAWGGRGEIVKYLLKDLQCNVNVEDMVRLKLIYIKVYCALHNCKIWCILCCILIPYRVMQPNAVVSQLGQLVV